MKIGIVGINGKMGKAVAKLVVQNDLTDIASGLVRKGSDFVNQAIGNIIDTPNINAVITDDIELFFKKCDTIVDFSSPSLTVDCAKMASKHNKILVTGTTGLDQKQKILLKEFSQNTVIISSSNMSIGVNLLITLSEKVARVLNTDYDAEIFEIHHRNKVDAPSGTALELGEAIAKGRGLEFGKVSRKTRNGITGKRTNNEIGFSSLRGGDIVGDHTAIFAGIGERIELSHKASSRDIYANGAIRAAIWATSQKNGIYSMQDVLKSIV